jgi:hypothetical protein
MNSKAQRKNVVVFPCIRSGFTMARIQVRFGYQPKPTREPRTLPEPEI